MEDILHHIEGFTKMSQDSLQDDNMTEWVGMKKAAAITGLHGSNLHRNAMAGRVPIRVKEGHLYFYRPFLETFAGAPLGNPNLLVPEGVALVPDERLVFKKIRTEIENRFDDVIYRFSIRQSRTALEISVRTSRGWSTLPLRWFT
jgi:hypothetical protein